MSSESYFNFSFSGVSITVVLLTEGTIVQLDRFREASWKLGASLGCNGECTGIPRCNVGKALHGPDTHVHTREQPLMYNTRGYTNIGYVMIICFKAATSNASLY